MTRSATSSRCLALAGLASAFTHAQTFENADIGSPALPGSTLASEPPETDAEAVRPSVCDRIWSLTTLYQNDENPIIQEFSLSGRLQGDAFVFDADQGRKEAFTWRRFRFGFKSSFAHGILLHVESALELNSFDTEELDDVYDRFTDVYLGWSRSEVFTLKVGKQSAPFTLDGATSSKDLIALERSTVAANLWFPTEYFTGLGGFGKVNDWAYRGGVYSASGDEEFSSFDSGYFLLGSVGREFARALDLDTGKVRVDYVYDTPDNAGEVGTRNLRHVVSLVTKFQKRRVGVWTDLSFGAGIGQQGNLLGLQFMPFYDLTEKWQLALRYTLVVGSRPNSVRLNRYETLIESGRSDEAHEVFLGLNWYLYGHKLKWQNGLEYTRAFDSANDGGAYRGWGFTSGLRLSW